MIKKSKISTITKEENVITLKTPEVNPKIFTGRVDINVLIARVKKEQ